MNKKEFKITTTKIYEEYGFLKKGKYFYLDLEDVLICSGFSHAYGCTYLAYNVSIKALHSENERKMNDMFDGYDSTENQICFNEKEKGIYQIEICYEKYTKEEYEKKLTDVLHKHFDPYKNDAIGFIKKCCTEVGVLFDNETMLLKAKAKKYLEI
ncbi:MAG: hypothetical protein II984_11325 [Clostridia bacterium]|nr:hypothetical protein [Clostridia bacterium]